MERNLFNYDIQKMKAREVWGARLQQEVEHDLLTGDA